MTINKTRGSVLAAAATARRCRDSEAAALAGAESQRGPGYGQVRGPLGDIMAYTAFSFEKSLDFSGD